MKGGRISIKNPIYNDNIKTIDEVKVIYNKWLLDDKTRHTDLLEKLYKKFNQLGFSKNSSNSNKFKSTNSDTLILQQLVNLLLHIIRLKDTDFLQILYDDVNNIKNINDVYSYYNKINQIINTNSYKPIYPNSLTELEQVGLSLEEMKNIYNTSKNKKIHPGQMFANKNIIPTDRKTRLGGTIWKWVDLKEEDCVGFGINELKDILKSTDYSNVSDEVLNYIVNSDINGINRDHKHIVKSYTATEGLRDGKQRVPHFCDYCYKNMDFAFICNNEVVCQYYEECEECYNTNVKYITNRPPAPTPAPVANAPVANAPVVVTNARVTVANAPVANAPAPPTLNAPAGGKRHYTKHKRHHRHNRTRRNRN